jgi:sRNA-binding carbon storage regulator CsrA
MLGLTRKLAKPNSPWEDKSKLILKTSDGIIEITTVKANSGEVRLFVNAPKKVTITRKETLSDDT